MTSMKKRKSGKRERGATSKRGVAKRVRGTGVAAGRKRSAAKGNRVAALKSVDKYLAAIAEPGRERLSGMREAIRSVVPTEAVEIISYRIPAFRHGKVLVWYAAFAEHCSLFPTAAVIEEFRDELKGYTTSKGTIQFPFREPLPVGLIKRIVQARMAAVASGK
jgi:uncharacterized protein YdhG (YjbR/CyaY superfamily)